MLCFIIKWSFDALESLKYYEFRDSFLKTFPFLIGVCLSLILKQRLNVKSKLEQIPKLEMQKLPVKNATCFHNQNSRSLQSIMQIVF